MVGLVVLSHSSKVVEGLKELIREMAQEVKVYAVGGTQDGELGSDFEKTEQAILDAYSDDGVIVLFDLGSTFMTAEMVIEGLPEEKKEKVKLVDAPLIEGGITAAVSISAGMTMEDVISSLEPLKIGKL
ncbi:MAG: dihydroxyacetone kinase phosphoryl donor subunit DhaM [Clostridiaceae bacterium]